MVTPGVTTRKPRVDFRLPGRRTALIVCQAMSIATHGGLPGAGGELQRQPREARIGLLAGLVEMIEDLPFLPAALGGDLGQPDRGLHRLDLAEEGPDVSEPMAAPMLQEPRRLRRHLPGAGIGKLAPPIHARADAADERGQVVLLRLGTECLRGLVEDDLGLPRATLLRLRDRRDERDLASLVADLVRRLAARVEPSGGTGTRMASQDRLLEKVGSILRQVALLNVCRALFRGGTARSRRQRHRRSFRPHGVAC